MRRIEVACQVKWWFTIWRLVQGVFASLAWAIQYLIGLQKYQLQILKWLSTINCFKEYEPGVLFTLCATQI